MGSKLLYFLLLIVVFASGCLPSNKNSSPVAYPSGTFTGQFRRVHVAIKTGIKDTLSANITLTINTTTGFKIAGDTLTVITGSYGSYGINSSYAKFNDVTYSATTSQTKIHLQGTYEY